MYGGTYERKRTNFAAKLDYHLRKKAKALAPCMAWFPTSKANHARIELIGKHCSYEIAYPLLPCHWKTVKPKLDHLVFGYSTASKRLYDLAKCFINAVEIRSSAELPALATFRTLLS